MVTKSLAYDRAVAGEARAEVQTLPCPIWETNYVSRRGSVNRPVFASEQWSRRTSRKAKRNGPMAVCIEMKTRFSQQSGVQHNFSGFITFREHFLLIAFRDAAGVQQAGLTG